MPATEQELERLEAEYIARFDDMPMMRIDTTDAEAIELIKKTLRRDSPLVDDDFPKFVADSPDTVY